MVSSASCVPPQAAASAAAVLGRISGTSPLRIRVVHVVVGQQRHGLLDGVSGAQLRHLRTQRAAGRRRRPRPRRRHGR
jgi:hypothetical protein